MLGEHRPVEDADKRIKAGVKSLAGGELKSYAVMLTEARMETVRRMTESASALGADSVIMHVSVHHLFDQ